MNQSQLADIHREMSSAALDLMLKKNQDYAEPDKGDVFGNLDACEVLNICSTEEGILIRMLDKFRRLATSTSRELLVADESVTDTLRDLINYVVLYEAKRRSRTESSPKEETPTIEPYNTHKPPFTENELARIPSIFLSHNAESGMPYIFRRGLGGTLRPYQVGRKGGGDLFDDTLGNTFFTLDQAVSVANAAHKERQLEKPADEPKEEASAIEPYNTHKRPFAGYELAGGAYRTGQLEKLAGDPQPAPDDGELDEDKWDTALAPDSKIPARFQEANVEVGMPYIEFSQTSESGRYSVWTKLTLDGALPGESWYRVNLSFREALDAATERAKTVQERLDAERLNQS